VLSINKEEMTEKEMKDKLQEIKSYLSDEEYHSLKYRVHLLENIPEETLLEASEKLIPIFQQISIEKGDL
jgi:Zn-dependent M16 (insulinase) family peptidase